jgi:hypothetical protein
MSRKGLYFLAVECGQATEMLEFVQAALNTVALRVTLAVAAAL